MVCNKKGCHKACVTCLVAYHNHCGHVCPSAAPPSQQAPPDPPAAPAQPPSNEDPPADEDPPASYAACGGKCGHRNASSGQCGCTEEICGCGYRFKGRVSGGERLQHFTSMKHDAWVHAPPPQPAIFRSIERFVVKGAAPDIPSDAQPEVPDSEDAILLPPPPDRHPTPCGGYMPEGHTQQSLIQNWPFFLDAQDLVAGTIHSWKWMEALAGFRSCHCTGWSFDGHSCAACASLKHSPALAQRLRIAMAPEPHTEYKYRGTLALHARLHEYRAMEQKAFFDVRTMQRSFQPLRSQVSYHQRLVEAIRTNNVPRVATVLNAAKKRGYGLKRLVGLVEDAATANRTRYSVDEKNLCVLLYRAGGPSVCHALSQAHLLPSLSHCRGLAKQDTIPLSSEFSFASCFQAWAGKPAIGLTEHRDDIFLNPRLSLGKNDMIEGLCECAPPKRFEALADLHEVMEKLQSGEWHLAKYARVVALSRHSETGYECIPVSCQASCNRFKAVSEQQSVETLLDMWEPHAAQYGPILCHASDADSRRRAALREMCLPPTAYDGQPLRQKVVTKRGATVSRDMRHVLKRTTRMFLNKGITIDDVHLTPDVLVGLGKTMKLRYVDALSAALQRPDFMSAPDALIVLRAIVSCGSVEDGWRMDQLDPSRRKQQSAMQKLHSFLKHAHAYYFENTHTLLTRLKHAATASDHLFALQVAFAPFGPALYYDWQLELCGVVDEVEIFQREFPGEPFFICHRGNDRSSCPLSVMQAQGCMFGMTVFIPAQCRFLVPLSSLFVCR